MESSAIDGRAAQHATNIKTVLHQVFIIGFLKLGINRLKNLTGYPSACLSIGKCMVVMQEMESAQFGHSVQLMVGSLGESTAGSPQRTQERIVGIIHAITSENGFQTVLVKRLVVCHEGQALDERLHLSPDIGEHPRFIGISPRESMHTGAPIRVVIGFGLDK
jgi:hypothetical protein